MLHNSPTLRAPSGSAAEPACESELPLISQELPQELPRTADSVATLSGDAQWFHGYTQWLHQCTGASTGDSIGASTLISQDLTQELPLISQELPPEIPQPLPQEASEALRLRLRLRLRELPPGQVKRMLIAHVRHCRNRWRCGTCRKVRERLATLRLQL